MFANFIKIIPVLIMFLLGFLSKKFKLFNDKDADRFLNFTLYIALPALTITSITELKLNLNLLYLIFYPIVIILITYYPASLLAKKYKLPKTTFGTFLIGSLIINTGFVSTFIFAFFGEIGFGYYSLYDLGNSLMIYSFCYYQAIKYSGNDSSKLPIKKILAMPPIWGIIIGLVLNLCHVQLNNFVGHSLYYIGAPTMPMIIFSLGIYFSPKIKNWKLSFSVIALRMLLGLALGVIIVNMFNIQKPISDIVIICSSAPVGFNTLIFSEIENLDKKFAATIVSFSILLSLIFVSVYSFFI